MWEGSRRSVSIVMRIWRSSMCESLRWAIRMAVGKGGTSLGRGGGLDPRAGCAGDKPPGRMGPGGEAQSLQCENDMGFSPLSQVSPGERKGFVLPETLQKLWRDAEESHWSCRLPQGHHPHIRLGCTGSHPQCLLLFHVPCSWETRVWQGPSKPSHPPSYQKHVLERRHRH